MHDAEIQSGDTLIVVAMIDGEFTGDDFFPWAKTRRITRLNALLEMSILSTQGQLAQR
jgi:hypothetical protein